MYCIIRRHISECLNFNTGLNISNLAYLFHSYMDHEMQLYECVFQLLFLSAPSRFGHSLTVLRSYIIVSRVHLKIFSNPFSQRIKTS
jgi:hypothetical protein